MVKHHRQPATAVGLVSGALMLAAGYFRGESAVLTMFALGVAATFLWFVVGPAAGRKDVAANIGLTVLKPRVVRSSAATSSCCWRARTARRSWSRSSA